MTLQAQYLSPAFKKHLGNNVLEEFQRHGGIFASYNNQGGQQHIFNGTRTTVFSEPESELTCTNISSSRKRNRDDHHHHQQFRFSKLPDIQQLYDSQGTSTSGRSYGYLPHDLKSQLLHQNQEMDTLILLQNEIFRSGLQDTRKRHCKSLLSILELQVSTRLEEKEAELANASQRNAELEEKLKQMNAENQMWFNVAKNTEAIVCTLKSNLEQILLPNQGQLREGFGDSDSLADDAQPCSPPSMVAQNCEHKLRKSCKVCKVDEISVMLLPCRHLCLCRNCESKIDSCPICKSVKITSLHILTS